MKVFYLLLLVVPTILAQNNEPSTTPACPVNEVYKTCGPIGCQLSCAMYLARRSCPFLSLRCGHGCYCKDNYVRSNNGACVPQDSC
ncbi:unnamed protein product [Hermetia illucens]|uniref:TIL domain-containing protein n=1 Tax=Hermetia illucens TaxID=343691 RepID=A0A7R8UUC9_HERIL|nr:chymotrypsin inhibitor-like [Hermetia illucens]CAD7087239.1 unnamed protein product [Hermetia illucens]